MKLIVKQSNEYKEPEIMVSYRNIDKRLSKLIELIKLFSFSIKAQKDNTVVSVALEDVYYFDSVDNKVFLYTENEVYHCDKKLYEIEEAYCSTTLARVSKNCILNIIYVASVQTQLSGRLAATLKNGEKIIISRHYIKGFRNKFFEEGAK